MIVVVTGGGSGIGEAISRRFADEGAQVAVLDQNLAAAELVSDQIMEAGGGARAFCCDVTDYEQVKTTMKLIAKTYSGLTTLVNNAGVGHIGNVEMTTPEDLDRIYRVNIKGVYNCLNTCIPLLKKTTAGLLSIWLRWHRLWVSLIVSRIPPARALC